MAQRLLFTAPASGSGKTTLVCGLLQALKDQGHRPTSYKSGPDYIDPMFHSRILATPCHNLDLFLMGQEAVENLLAESSETIAILEGAMGYYDGIAMGERASAYQLATLTKTPTILVVDGRGCALSIAALVQGFAQFRPESQIKGVIFNRISPMLYPRLKEVVETNCQLPVFGFLPPCPEATLESRHLGLVTPDQVEAFQEKVRALGQLVASHIDLPGLLQLSATAPDLPSHPRKKPEQPAQIPLAIAQDGAFSFYYRDNLRRLEEAGFLLCPFSPLKDQALPEGCAGLYLGGGYPELHAKILSENLPLRQALYTAIGGGLPTIAECGGFLYLHGELQGADGVDYPMVGVIQGRAFATKKLSRFGYVTLTAQKEGLLGEAGTQIPAHQFHYWDTTNHGADFLAEKPESSRHWTEAHTTPTLYAGFPHFHFATAPQSLDLFYKACNNYHIGGPLNTAVR